MKKLTANAVVAAIGLVWGSAALAGSIQAPATTVKYAVESMTNTTDITLPVVTYRMGVDRTVAQDFTVVIKPSSGAAFTVASCTTAIPTITLAGGAAGVFSATVKRASASECAYEVDVTTAFVRGAGTIDLNFTGLVLDSHTLAAAGNTAGVTVGLWDLGETARIDNSGDLTANAAFSGYALTMTAAQDTATIADVNHVNGPLFGFLANATVPADTAAIAAANFVIRNNNDGTNTWMKPDGTTPWNYVVDGTNIAITVTGDFAQLLANGFLAASAVGPAITASATATTGTFSIAPANTGANGTSTNITVSFTSAQNASMGTARTFGVSGVGDVITGADVVLSGNASWWVWGANASQLMTPYFSTYSAVLSRFFLLNTGANTVSYSADCFAESANVITYGAARTGTLTANGLTAVNASDICTFSGNTRGAVRFTINAPINTVKANYQSVDPVTLNQVIAPLTRPYNQANTTE